MAGHPIFALVVAGHPMALGAASTTPRPNESRLATPGLPLSHPHQK